MNNDKATYLDVKPITLILAVVTWLVPFVVSGFMYDPETKEFLPNFVVFKAVMIAILIAVTVPAYILLTPSSHGRFRFSTATTFLVINIAIDFAVLITILKVPFLAWLVSVLPIYILVFYLLAAAFDAKTKRTPTSRI